MCLIYIQRQTLAQLVIINSVSMTLIRTLLTTNMVYLKNYIGND